MGNQGHSDANYWQMKTLVANGFVKDVTHVDAYMCANNRRWFKWNGTLTEMPGEEAEPAEMDWDVWLSQRPFRPFNHNFINGDWRCFYEYGTGALGDWGAHLFDAAHEFLKLGLPTRIETIKNDRRTNVVFPMASTIRYVFPARGDGFPECTLDWHDGAGNFPAAIENVTDRKWTRKVNGAELHLKDGRVFARGSHGAPLQLIAGADPYDPENQKDDEGVPEGEERALSELPQGGEGRGAGELRFCRGRAALAGDGSGCIGSAARGTETGIRSDERSLCEFRCGECASRWTACTQRLGRV